MIMMNSIQAYLQANPVTKVAEVRQVLNHNLTGNKVLLLVEGVDDEAFYQSYLNTGMVYVYALYGCEHFQNILHTFNPLYPGKLLVIKDADFDHLNGITYAFSNLFLTDQHDYEMMMVTPDRVKYVAEEYGLSDTDAAGIYDCVVDNISDYSYIKWHNSRRRTTEMGINFKATKAVRHYGMTISESLDILRPVQHQGVVLDQGAIETLKNSNIRADRRQLINGHDFCKMIPKAIKDIKMKNIKDKDIPQKLKSHYTKADFSATHLANSLETILPGVVLR